MSVQEMIFYSENNCARKKCILSKTIFSAKRYRENKLYGLEEHTKGEALINV